MANGHGGYRKPEKPAAVSGPGKLSKRTDGGPASQAKRLISGLDYGENGEANAVAAAAPMGTDDEVPGLGPLPEGFFGFDEGSQYPDEPETEGMNEGPGRGYEPNTHTWDDEDEEDTFDPIATAIREAYVRSPTAELGMLLDRLEAEGR